MTLIDGDRIVTAQLYDDEYEEFTEKKMSIIDCINTFTDEGVTKADDVLDKLRNEIEQTSGTIDGFLMHDGTKRTVLQILDKYKAESEVDNGNNNH